MHNAVLGGGISADKGTNPSLSIEAPATGCLDLDASLEASFIHRSRFPPFLRSEDGDQGTHCWFLAVYTLAASL